MTKLAKQIARVLMVMGLESSTLRGVAANPMSDTDSQCSLEPNAYNQYEPFSYTAIFLMTMVFLVWYFSWQGHSNGQRMPTKAMSTAIWDHGNGRQPCGQALQ